MKYLVAILISKNGKFLVEIDENIKFPIFEFEKKNGYLLKTLFRVLEEEMNIIPLEIWFVKRVRWRNRIISIYWIRKFRGRVNKKFVWASSKLENKLSALSRKILSEWKNIKKVGLIIK